MRQSFLEGEPPLLIAKLERGLQMDDETDVSPSRGKSQTLFDSPEALSFMRTGTYTLCGVLSHYGSGVDEEYYNTHCRMATLGETQVAGQPAYCLLECPRSQRHYSAHGKTCRRERRRKVYSFFCTLEYREKYHKE